MLQASSERPAAAAGAGGIMWVPGMRPVALMDAGSARAQAIARRREEMMGMLQDLPESEYELSLTDLVEKAGGGAAAANGEAAAAAAATERKETAAAALAEQQIQPQPLAGRAPERRGSLSRRRESGGGSSLRSSSDGVLLNFYMPRSLTRSFTAPRPSRTLSITGGGGGGGRTPSVASSDCNKRERDPDADTVKCWSLPWRKSSRRERDPPAAPPSDNVRAAILKGAKHSTSTAKV